MLLWTETRRARSWLSHWLQITYLVTRPIKINQQVTLVREETKNESTMENKTDQSTENAKHDSGEQKGCSNIQLSETLTQKLSIHSSEQDHPASEMHRKLSQTNQKAAENSQMHLVNGHHQQNHARKTSDQRKETETGSEPEKLTSFRGIVAFITGGASGLGEAVAKHLVKKGAKVAIYDISVAGEKLAANLGHNCIFFQGDVSDSEMLITSVDKTEATFGAFISLNVNCAGTATSRLLFDQKNDKVHCEKSFERVMKTNVFGTFNVMRHLSKAMAKNQGSIEEGNGGLIINTGSISGFEGSSGQVAYSASKGAIESMTLPAARDLASLGIRVVTIAPGFFDTPLLNQAPEAMVNQIARTIPLCPKRLGRPSEFAHMVQCLYENPMINGTVIRMDCGGRMPPYVFPPSTRSY